MTTATQTVINVVDRDGASRSVEWEPGQTLMETLRDNDFEVLASCGGTASCATCHVFLDKSIVDELGERSEDELELLEESEHYDANRSRLSCQVDAREALDGATVTVAPEED
ncbi:2Fe-2S iron-sulfur cluster-binding protein [Gordonia humi]|uniref:2Fe-2S ferredoxin n=1 Tax=Gordonia humi TaxID=686429 RepID=A0A840ETC2_9ACTN|nr:2Fe-2S iron-sulfur cluster-binding protein [Gordonia humi]MBB4133543.1 2Fe-2S ferredoxin [Gordonia humi]